MTRKPTVFVDARAVFADIGGVGRAVLATVRELSRSGAVRLRVLNNHPSHWNGLPDLEVLGHQAPTTGSLEARVWWEQTQLRGLVKRSGADLLWSPWNWGIPLLLGLPSVLTVHDLIPLRRANPMGSRLRSAVYRSAVAQSIASADRIVCASDFSRQELNRRYPRTAGAASVVHWGLDPQFRPGPPQAVDGELRVLYVGGLEARKNVARLFEACELAQAQLGPLRVVLRLTGRRECLDSAAASIFDRISSRCDIEFMGHMPDAELPGLYRWAHLFVFPSLEEGFGFPPLEAQACGVPVVCGRCDSIPEVVGSAAMFVDVNDAGAMAAAIGRVARSDSERTMLRDRGLANASRFDWGRCAGAHLDVFASVL